jgi:hypothetical protein
VVEVKGYRGYMGEGVNLGGSERYLDERQRKN